MKKILTPLLFLALAALAFMALQGQKVSFNEEIPEYAMMEFEETVFHYDTVTAGTIVEYKFDFTNESAVPLQLQKVTSSCGCVVPNASKRLFLPGEKGNIQVRFDTKLKSGRNRKSITITANTETRITYLYLDGHVKPSDSQRNAHRN